VGGGAVGPGLGRRGRAGRRVGGVGAGAGASGGAGRGAARLRAQRGGAGAAAAAARAGRPARRRAGRRRRLPQGQVLPAQLLPALPPRPAARPGTTLGLGLVHTLSFSSTLIVNTS